MGAGGKRKTVRTWCVRCVFVSALLLFGLLGVLWPVSHYRQLQHQRSHVLEDYTLRSVWIGVASRRLYLSLSTSIDPSRAYAPSGVLRPGSSSSFWSADPIQPTSSRSKQWTYGFQKTRNGAEVLGVRIDRYRSPADPARSMRERALEINIPCSYALVLAGMSAFVLWRSRWFNPRPPGTCRRCGYDLRATPDRCPECGMAVPEGHKPEVTPTPSPSAQKE